ncbi:MAG: PEP-CTERM sorting domain-containing protein [Planctomycetota bacterium]
MSIKIRSTFSFLVALAVACTSTGSVTAATLSSFPGAITSGSAPYSAGTLVGTIEFAVFTEAVFESNFSGFDVPSGELAYAYQVLNGAGDFVSSNTVIGLNSSVTGIGDFTVDNPVAEVSPVSATLAGGSASWSFAGQGNNIPANGLSSGLVITSTNLPNPTPTQVDIIVNGGGSAFTFVIGPGDVPIPEPTTLALSCLTFAFCGFRRSR